MKSFLQKLLALGFIILPFHLQAQTELWGTTVYGGTGYGSIFKLNGDGTNVQNVYDFTNGADGSEPTGGLIQAANGKLYGLTNFGGASSKGILFEFDPVVGTITPKVDFNGSGNGERPMGTLLEASNGKLYGMTAIGGTSNMGVLFVFDITTGILTKLVDFDGTNTGRNAGGNALFEASNGKIYGALPNGGANNNGTFFELDMLTNTFVKKADFLAATTGHGANGMMVEVTPGKLYGTTSSGGGGSGAIFSYDINSNVLANEQALNSSSAGSMPAGLALADNGKLYGTTLSGGVSFAGTMFEYDPNLDSITKILDFGSLDTGALSTYECRGTPMQAANGKIYATSTYGCSSGSIFEYDFVTDTYIVISSIFDDTGGNEPRHVQLLEIQVEPAAVWPGDCNADLVVDNTDFLQLGLAWNSSGSVRPGATTNYTAQPCPLWIGVFPYGLNYRHADTNGDGNVNMNDSAAIYINYGQTHPFRLSAPTALAAGEFYLVPDDNAVAPGQVVTYSIHLSDNTAPIDNIYGIAFTLAFDPALVDTTQMTLNYTPSVLGTMNADMEKFDKGLFSSGSIGAAVTRTDLQDAINVSGVLGTFAVKTSALVSVASSLQITPSNIVITTVTGDVFTLDAASDPVVIDPALSGINELNDQGISVYPNPATGFLNFESKSGIIHQIELIDAIGRTCLITNPETSTCFIKVDAFEPGIYTVKSTTSEGVSVRKVMIR